MNIKKVKTIDISPPTEKLASSIYTYLNSLNFHTPKEYWHKLQLSEHLITEYPIYIKEKSPKKYELLGGFRSFQILSLMKIEKFSAFDASNLNETQQKKITLVSNVHPLLMWSVNARHAQADLGNFLKILDQVPVDEEKMFDARSFNESISRHSGRIRDYQESKLSKLLKTRLATTKDADDE